MIFRVCRSPLGLSVDQTDHIMKLVNEWFPTGNLIKFDTPFRKESAYENELLSAFPLTGNAHHKAEMEYHGKFGHTLGRIQHIALMIIIYLFYATCCLATQNVAPTLPGFQDINLFVQYLASQPHKPILYPSHSYDGSNFIRLTWSLHDALPISCRSQHTK